MVLEVFYAEHRRHKMAKPIGTLGTVETLQIGGRVFTDLTNLIKIGGYVSSTTKTTLRKSGSSSGYQVTALKTLTLAAITMTLTGAAGSSPSGQIGYADNDVGLNQSTSLTNPNYIFADSVANWVSNEQNTQPQVLHIDFPVPASKYVFVLGNGTTLLYFAFGYET